MSLGLILVIILIIFLLGGWCRRWGGRNMGGVVSGVFNLESSGVSASDWRPRHDKHYHEA
jgi:hypothetical protein